MMQVSGKNGSLTLSKKAPLLSMSIAGEVWTWKDWPTLLMENGDEISLAKAECQFAEHATGIGRGAYLTFRKVPAKDGTLCPFEVHLHLWLENTSGDLLVETTVLHEEPAESSRNALKIKQISLPPFDFGAKAGEGYTILSRMQGLLLPAEYEEEFKRKDQPLLERCAYMPIFGQKRAESGYLLIYETPFDAAYHIDHSSGGDTIVTPVFSTSLGQIRYTRVLRYCFRKGLCYNGMAKLYRQYLKARGDLVTLEQKIAKNPNIAKLIGTPIVHTGIAQKVHEMSHYYKPDDPDFNDRFVPFSLRAEQLTALKEKGVDRVYLHLDGWGKHGYDNLHPSPFPPHERAGGADGMRELAKTCQSLGYVFGIHDQYRDYYYDAPDFDMDNAILNGDGSHPYCDTWFGGPHTYLCPSLSPYYVRRNYEEFERLEIPVEGAYLDVFSVIYPDECFHPMHKIDREGSAAAWNHCFDILNEKGIIPSSEEAVVLYLKSLALCHHAPYYLNRLGYPDSGLTGVALPLWNLVCHDCLVIPWEGAYSDKAKGGWGCPDTDWGFLHCLLNGGAPYLSITAKEEEIERVKIAAKLHENVALHEMASHEFLNESGRKQQTVFANGTVVTVDFDENTWDIQYA
ncbi:MAG TPA: hypothetical protein GX701_03200 [Clostridiales bacterium]|jgi:hypothetical protein|nr:hypothetical protein [Clostridiales bacterium]